MQLFNGSTASSGAATDSGGDDWLIVTEIPAKDVGSGRLVALGGFVGSVFKPETKIVVI